MQEKDAGLKSWLANFGKKKATEALSTPSFQEASRQFAKDLGESVVSGGKKELTPLLKQIQETVEQKAPEVAGQMVDKATKQVGESLASLVQRLSAAATLGGLAGAAVAPSGERQQGAVRGAVGGVIGGATGAAWGKSLLPAVGGAILGGAASGATLRNGNDSEQAKEFAMQGFKYAGVTLDWYDDQGDTLKHKFPTIKDVPSIIKTANVPPKEKVANEQFALVMIDRGHVFRKFACVDPGTTAMSTIYFMEHGDKLPEGAKKLAAANLVDACTRYGLLPPAAMTKAAGQTFFSKLANGDEPEDEGSPPTEEQRNKIREFIRANPNLSDDEFHAFVEKMGLNPHFAEAVVYDMAHELSKEGADIIAGGKADKKDPKDFPSDQMAMGQKVEMEHTNTPALAREISRDHLEEFPDYYTRLDKMEAEAKKAKEKKANDNVINVTGQKPAPLLKHAQPKSDDDYALVLSDGTRRYPIHTWDLVKKASDYFHENKRRMHPEHRRQYAVKLARKSFIIGFPLDGEITELGASGYGANGHLKVAVEMRKVACNPQGPGREFLNDLFEKHASMHPEVYAEVLRRFDIEEGLDRGWDHVIPDPWASTFGVKTASVVWEDGAERVTDDELINIAQNHMPRLQMEWTDDFAHEFRKDPVGIFNSLPAPQKKILARFATDMASSGGTEYGTAEPRRANG